MIFHSRWRCKNGKHMPGNELSCVGMLLFIWAFFSFITHFLYLVLIKRNYLVQLFEVHQKNPIKARYCIYFILNVIEEPFWAQVHLEVRRGHNTVWKLNSFMVNSSLQEVKLLAAHTHAYARTHTHTQTLGNQCLSWNQWNIQKLSMSIFILHSFVFNMFIAYLPLSTTLIFFVIKSLLQRLQVVHLSTCFSERTSKNVQNDLAWLVRTNFSRTRSSGLRVQNNNFQNILLSDLRSK